jgi:DNA-binding MarR family transcriptional regulator
VKPVSERDLRILTAISQRQDLTQRNLSKSLGIALGLTNLYLKRLARKGYIKITTIPPNRLRYLVTPKGFAQKTRLTYEYMQFSLVLYRETRESLRDALRPAIGSDGKRVALCGTGEAAELAYLTLKEIGIEPLAVFADAGPPRFLDLPRRPLNELVDADFDHVIVAGFLREERQIDRLVQLGLSRDKLIVLGGRKA